MLIEHELLIDEDVDIVWSLTIDVESLPSITPTMTSVERLDQGPMGVGSQARIVQPKQGPRIWTVTRFEPPADGRATFEWETRLGPLTMTGRHELAAVDGGTMNHLSVELTGAGSGIVGRIMRGQVATAIRTENEGFRRAAAA